MGAVIRYSVHLVLAVIAGLIAAPALVGYIIAVTR